MFNRADWSLFVRVLRTATSASVGLLLSLPADAQQSRNVEWCEGRGDPTLDQRILACSELIQSGDEIGETKARAYGNRGVAYDNKGDPEHARLDFDEAVRLDPASASGHRFQGNSYRTKKDYEHAIAEYNEAIKLDPNDALAFNNRGTVYAALKDYDRAVADRSEAIRINPAFAQAFHNRGMTYRVIAEWDRAIADFDEAIRLQPKFAAAFAGRGLAYADKKDFDRAVADFTEALTMDPPERVVSQALNNRCWARFVIGRDLQGAIADCTELLNLQPKDISALSFRGFSYYKLGEFKRAIVDFDSALAINPAAAMPLFGRGLAKRRTGNAKDADKDMEMAKKNQSNIGLTVALWGVL